MHLNDIPPADLLRDASLFLDFDGTLVELADRPDLVVVSDRVIALLRLLEEKLMGRVAILSGRPLREIDAYLGVAALPACGSHGLEVRFADGRGQTVAPPVNLDEVAVEMGLLEQEYPGILIEIKPFGAALHYRRVPRAESACRELAKRLARSHGLNLQPGKMLFELRAPGGDKGLGLRALMAQQGWEDTRPIFIGDDLTDESAFTAARDMGGAGILVGERRQSAASYRLEDVAATLAWLERAAAAVQ